jgi:predicted NAD-dependent protein-ADP-ribosyltransferase YbiA (DUF1768 family)
MDRLVFFARSADKPAGSGVGDVVARPDEYVELTTIPHWRRIFSTLWDGEPFTYQGRTYRSLEHALQALKFASCGRDDIAIQFAKESGTPLSKGSGVEAYQARRMVTLPKELITVWDQNKRILKKPVYRAKYTQCPTARRALLATRQAELWNSGPRIETTRCITLEEIRAELLAQAK